MNRVRQMMDEWKSFFFEILPIVVTVIAIIALALLCILIPVWLLYTAWAAVAVPVFHWPPVTFWQVFWIWMAISVVSGCFKVSVSNGKK